MSDYHDCDSRDDCDAAREERDELKAENERLRAILRDIWHEGMQDGLSHDLGQRVDAEVGDECRSADHQQTPADK